MVAVAAPATQRVVIRDVSWGLYELLLAGHLDKSAPRFTFDRGTLEIMSPGRRHERTNRSFARLIWTVGFELGIEIEDVGSMTYKRSSVRRGFEPDSSFYLRLPGRLDSDRDFDPEVDPPPDLVIEIDVSRSSIPKLELFAALQVPEVWLWDGEQVSFFHLRDVEYVSSHHSRLISELTSAIVTEFILSSMNLTDAAWHRSIVEWARTLR